MLHHNFWSPVHGKIYHSVGDEQYAQAVATIDPDDESSTGSADEHIHHHGFCEQASLPLEDFSVRSDEGGVLQASDDTAMNAREELSSAGVLRWDDPCSSKKPETMQIHGGSMAAAFGRCVEGQGTDPDIKTACNGQTSRGACIDLAKSTRAVSSLTANMPRSHAGKVNGLVTQPRGSMRRRDSVNID